MPFSLKQFRKKQKETPSSSNLDVSGQVDSPVHVTKAGLISLHREAEHLSLKAGKIRSVQGGHYLSPFKGLGMAFDEVRPYQSGDDLRTIDWRVTARTGKPHTKLFREERERAVLFWVDFRAPMFFGTRGMFKSVMAARAAALLAWSAFHHGDRLGGMAFSEDQHEEVRPQRGKKGVLHFIQGLVEHPAWQGSPSGKNIDRETAALSALIRLRRVTHPGSLVFLISDFREMGTQFESHLVQLARHNDVVMLFIHDLLEQSLPPPGIYRVSDGTGEMTLDTASPSGRRAYQAKFHKRQLELKRLCQREGIYFLPCTTSENLKLILQNGLGLQPGKGAA